MKKTQQAFTLIELMIVVAIVGILASIAFQFYRNYTQRSANGACMAEAKPYMNTAVADLANNLPATAPQNIACVSGTTPTAADYAANTGIPFTPQTRGNAALIKITTCFAGNGQCELAP